MNKKVQKGLVAAVAATMGAGMVAPVASAAVQTASVSLDAQYKAAYDATQKALQTKTQKDLTAARVLVDSLYNTVKGTGNEYLATTLSAILDPAQQVKLVELFAAIDKATASVKQADINAARTLILEMPKQWIESFSSAIDTIQEGLIKKVVDAVEKTKTSKLQADFDVASALVTEIATVTNNDGVKAWAGAIKAELDKVELKVEITSVSATNPTTLTINGGGLKGLKADQITVAGNKVLSVNSADGKTATVTLEGKLAPNKEVIVKSTIDTVTTEYKVTYAFAVNSVTVNSTTFDDDRDGQKVTFRINGESADADVDYLTLAGYNVNFVATTKSNNTAAPIFVGPSATSVTGALEKGIAKDDYKVEVQITKSGSALVSNSADIRVVNLDAAATTIGTVTFANFGADKTNGTTYDGALALDDYKMISTTLVAGEKAGVQKVLATIAGVESTVEATGFKVETSNPAIISVDSTGVLTAESAGTATITIKVGDATKTINFTVTNTARKLTNVTANPATISLVKGFTTDVAVRTYDQYGDYYAVATGDITEVAPVDASSNALVSGLDVVTTTPDGVGKVTLKVKGEIKGTGSVFFKNSKGTVLGSFLVNVSDVNNVGSKKLRIISAAPNSTDTTLDMLDDNKVTYELAKYNTNGVYIDAENITAYTVEVVDATIAKVTKAASNLAFDIEGLKAGKTDVVLKNDQGVVVEKVTITVANDPIAIKTVNFKTVPTIDYIDKNINVKDVLDLTASAKDDIVNGITLSKSTQHKVRIVEATGATQGDLYLDENGDGEFTSGETVLGRVKAKVASGATGLTAGDITDIFAGVTTGATNKGTIIFSIWEDPADITTSIAGTSITVNVK